MAIELEKGCPVSDIILIKQFIRWYAQSCLTHTPKPEEIMDNYQQPSAQSQGSIQR